MRAAFLVSLEVLGGCGMEPLGAAETTYADITYADTECDPTRCGTNSPVIDTLNFHELNVDGLENAQHLRLLGLMQGGVAYRPHVIHGKLSGINTTAPIPMISGAALTGSQLIIQEQNGNKFAITIQSVGSLHYWAVLPGVTQDNIPRLETYNLQWVSLVGGRPQPVCGNPAGEPTGSKEDTLGMTARTAVVFEGDRIDTVTKSVSPTIEPAWFNIGCAGHAIAKLALTGHTEAAKSDGYVTSTLERQTMLKMIVGDYCGHGTAFTAPGEPLVWRDDRGWMPFWNPNVNSPVEARWTSTGAACLGAPRLDVNVPSPWPQGLGNPVADAIKWECSTLPQCADSNPQDQGGMHLVSANPI